MNYLQAINAIIIAIGIPTIVLALIFIGRKLQILDDLQKTTSSIKHNMKTISDYLTRNHTSFDPSELESMSPINLTPVGQKFIQNIGFDVVFKTHKVDFFEVIDIEHPRLKYDVEAAAFKAIVTLYNEKPYMKFLKVFFYNNPKRSIENVVPTLGVFVRDAYLSEHQEITE